MLTPVKVVKVMPEVLKKIDRATNDLYSRAVSKIRQLNRGIFKLAYRTDILKAS